MSRRPPSAGLTRKQQSRVARETRMQRIIVIATVVIAVSVIGLVGYGLVNEYYVIPNTAIARVNGDPITVPQLRDLYRWAWAQVSSEAPADLPQQTLDSLIQDQLVIQEAERLGVEVDEEAVEGQIRALIEQSYFSNYYYSFYASETEETLATPTPRPTNTPTSTYVYTLTPTATRTPDPTITPTATPLPTATPAGTPTPTPTSGPLPTPTTRPEEEYQAGYEAYLVGGGQAAGLSPARVGDLIHNFMRMQELYGAVADALDFEVPTTEMRAHVAHILLAEDDDALADELFQRIRDGEPFEELAAEYSIHSATAYMGGDLGWITANEEGWAPEFLGLAFNMPIGTVDGPVRSDLGLHLVWLYDRVEAPLSEYRIAQERQEAFDDYLTTLKDEADIWISEDWMRWIPEMPLPTAIPTQPIDQP